MRCQANERACWILFKSMQMITLDACFTMSESAFLQEVNSRLTFDMALGAASAAMCSLTFVPSLCICTKVHHQTADALLAGD